MPSEQWFRDLQREVAELRRRVEQLEDRAPTPMIPSQVRLAKTVEKSGEAYPASNSGADTFWIAFVDATFTEAQGDQTPTYQVRQTTTAPLYVAHARSGAYYEEGVYVWVVWLNGRWWILEESTGVATIVKFTVNEGAGVAYDDATFNVDNVSIIAPIGATQYPGGTAPTSVNNLLRLPSEDDSYGIAFYNEATQLWEGIPAMAWGPCEEGSA